MKPRYKKLIAIVAGVTILSLAGLLVLNAFRSNLVYFFSPSEVLEGKAPSQGVLRIGGLIEAGSASTLEWPVAALGCAGAFGGAGLRPIEPVTSGSLISVEGSKNDLPSAALPPIELVCSGSFESGAVEAPPGVGIGRLGVVDGARPGALIAGLWDWSFGGSVPGAVLCSLGNSNSMAVCAAPTTMIATQAAISSVFRNFRTRLPRVGDVSASSSIAIGCGIGGSACVDAGIAPDMGADIDDGMGGSLGGSFGARAGSWNCGSDGPSWAAFLNGHLNQPDFGPSDFGTFTGVSR